MSILICYDGSPSAKHALSVAQDTLRSEHAILMHVWSPPETVHADSFGTKDRVAGVSTQELENRAQERGREVTDEGRRLAGELGLNVDVRSERNRSTVWRTILGAANDVEAKLIVVGTHGGTAAQSDLLGSVANALASHSDRPVVVVPSGSGHTRPSGGGA